MKHIITALLLISTSTWAQKTEKVKPFSFTAVGDMPYFLPDDYARFDNVIRDINAANVDFTVHVGDFKSSSTPCSDVYYIKMGAYFQKFEKPLIYTPGDNEWTDCNKPEAGAYNPQERLEAVRKMFFKDHNSCGKKKMVLTSQSDTPAFAKFVENNLWDYNGIQFGTFHAVGTDNNKFPAEPERMKEFQERDLANLAWLEEIFKRAKETNKAAVVICTQADMFDDEKGTEGFETIIQKITNLSIDFGKPVLLINGDSHKFLIDKPLSRELDRKINKARVVENFTRLQLFGEQDMHAVKIIVDPAYTNLFHIEQLLVKGN